MTKKREREAMRVFKKERKEALEIAKDLHYPQKTLEAIANALSEQEIQKLLTKARMA